MGQDLAALALDLTGAEADVRGHLVLRSGGAFLGDASASARLKRTVLRCLLVCGLKRCQNGGYELQPVLTAQLGEAVMVSAAADEQQRALYRAEGHTLRELLSSLQTAGFIDIGSVHTAKCADHSATGLQHQCSR